jgi:CheY-like chemotaxis protein
LTTILWVDDEIDHLQSHIRYLEKHGLNVLAARSGLAALEILSKNSVDLVLMDQMMIGMDGLETVQRIRENYRELPVVMVTQSEEEELMDRALGGEADDYLTKPVNPSQIYLVIKRILMSDKLRLKKAAQIVVSDAARISDLRDHEMTLDDWIHIYRSRVEQDVALKGLLEGELRKIQGESIGLLSLDYSRFVERNYPHWIRQSDGPLMSHRFPERVVLPEIRKSSEVVLLVIDCMRYDQWLTMVPSIENLFHIETEFMCTLLPSATPYSRNAIFSGLLPRDIWRFYRNDWLEEYGAPGLNRFESVFLKDALNRLGFEGADKAMYSKISTSREGDNVRKGLSHLLENGFLAIVINFIDHLTHGRSELDLIRDLAPDVISFRKLTETWFEASFLKKLFRTLAARGSTVIVTSDHGSVQSSRITHISGARGMSKSVRYRFGLSLSADKKTSIVVRNPADWGLPDENPRKSYVFARADYLLLQSRMNHEDVKKFENSFQHGGVSFEETLVPSVILRSKKRQ